jgi:hypothetical protein
LSASRVLPVTKAAVGPGAPRMGSVAYDSSEAGPVAWPPALGHRAAVARVPARRENLVSFRFSVRLTRAVLATRHPFAETALGPVRCLRLCEPPRPKQLPGASGNASLAQSPVGGIRRQENRVVKLIEIPGSRKASRTCRPPEGKPPTCAPRRASRDCGGSPVRGRLRALLPDEDAWTAPAWPLR